MGQLRRRAVSAPSDLSHLDRRPLHPNTHGDVGAGHGVPARRSITLPQSPLSSSTGLGPRACLGQRSTRARAAGGNPLGSRRCGLDARAKGWQAEVARLKPSHSAP